MYYPRSLVHRDSHLILDVHVICGHSDELAILAGLDQIRDIFQLSDVEVVELDCEIFLEGDTVTDTHGHSASILSRYSNVRSLYLIEYPGGTFNVLNAVPLVVVCPKLQSLMLVEGPYGCYSNLDGLDSAIRSRINACAPLKELRIEYHHEQCVGSDEEASRSFQTRLQALVPVVEFCMLDDF